MMRNLPLDELGINMSNTNQFNSQTETDQSAESYRRKILDGTGPLAPLLQNMSGLSSATQQYEDQSQRRIPVKEGQGENKVVNL